jgi:sporulation protein YlmC with PRC-barrel domain
MKRKLFLTALSLGITGALLVAATTRAADDDPKSSSSSSKSDPSKSDPSKSDPSAKPDQGGAGSGSSTTSGMSHKITRTSQLTTAQVKSSSGEALGQVNDLLVNPNTGRIEFAVISLQAGAQSGKLTALPWQLIRASGEGQNINLTANVDQSKISTAETFDQTQWPDMSQPTWAQTIYSHYGVQRGGTGTGGRVPIGGSESGTGTSPSPGTAPDGKGTLNPPSGSSSGTPGSPGASGSGSSSGSKGGLK